MENYRKKQIAILITLVLIILAFGGATYAWFTLDRVTNTDLVTGKTNEDNVQLYISSQSGVSFTNTHQAEIKKIGQSDQLELMPESTADLEDFMYAVVSNGSNLVLTRDAKGQYYYHGRVYIKASSQGDQRAGGMTIYLDGSQGTGLAILEGISSQMVGASRVGITCDGKDPVILNFDDEKASKVAKCQEGKAVYIKDPSTYVENYLIKTKDGNATRPEEALMNIEFNKEYPIDIYYYLEGFDKDCTDEISKKDVRLCLALYGVVE